MRKFAWFVLLFTLGCARETRVAKDTPVILISVDTLRSDRLPAYGYGGVKTPALDHFAKGAIRYEFAFSHAPLTLPSHASIMTGQLPTEHGVRDNSGFQLSPKAVTLASLFQEKGYRTGAAVSSMVLRKSTGIAKGFEFYDDQMTAEVGEPIQGYAQRHGELTLASARDWLSKQAGAPFFFFLHLYEPHSPYEPPEPYASAYSNPYDGEIAYTDALLGELFADLKAKGLYEKSLIVLLSDHGEGLGDHGEQEHGLFLYREAIQVPLLIKLPDGKRGGEVVTENVGLSDLFSTLTSALKWGKQPGQKVSLLDQVPKKRSIYSESLDAERHFGWFRQTSVVHKELHFLRVKDEELYHFKSDPGEKNNLFGKTAAPTAAVALLEELGKGRDEMAQTSAADQELLRSLGYTAGGYSGDEVKKLSARELPLLREDFVRAQQLVGTEGRTAEGEALLEKLLQRFPGFIDVRVQLAVLARGRGAFERVEQLLGEAVAGASRDARVLAYLAEANLLLGKRAAGEALALRAVSLDPIFSGRVLLPRFQQLGMRERMLAVAELMLAVEPEPMAVRVKVRELLQAEKLEAAVELSAKGLAECGAAAPAALRAPLLAIHAETLARVGKAQEAEPLLREALILDPKSVEVRQLLVGVLLQMGKPGEVQLLCREGLLLDPARWELYPPLFLAELRAKREEAALGVARTMIAKNLEMAVGPIAFYCMRFARPATSEAYAGMVLKRWPDNPHALFLRGRVRHDAKRYKESLDPLRRAADQAEKVGETALLADAAFFAGDSCASLGDGKGAVEFFLRATAARPDFAEAQVSMAAIYSMAGRSSDAIQIIDHWLARFPQPENRVKALELMKRFGLTELAAHFGSAN